MTDPTSALPHTSNSRQAACESFRTFYLSTHSGRRLTFQPNMGTADLRAVFGGGRRHELNVSTYQVGGHRNLQPRALQDTSA